VAKWLVILAWIVLAAAIAPLGSNLAGRTDDQAESYLPAGAESARVMHRIDRAFPHRGTITGLLVYRRPGGLTRPDRRVIVRDARAIAAALPLAAAPAVPFRPGSRGLVAADGSVAYTVLALPDDDERAADWGRRVREIAGSEHGGMSAYLTGDLGFDTDTAEAFGSIDTTLLGATVLLVLALLGAIYRSPVIALIPLVVVGVSYAVARGLVDLYVSTGATVSLNAVSVLVVLMFGVGTDYCLLLVARYREELRRTEDPHGAMAGALRRAGPSIVASGLTVALTMLVLLAAETESTRTFGPVAAIGVACTMAVGLTLLPALLTLAGRRGFWPRGSLVAYDPGAPAVEREGVWRRVGGRALRRPALALASTVTLFAASALGLLAYKETSNTTGFFRTPVDSVEGFRALERGFPGGLLDPTIVLVERHDGPIRPADVNAVERRLGEPAGVARVTASPRRSADGRLAQVDVVLRGDPYGAAALDLVPRMRRAVAHVRPGVTALVGGGSAVQYDYDRATARDLRVIVPLALAVIAVVLGLILRAVVSPLALIASVVVSFFGTLGLSLLFVRYAAGEPGVDNSLPTFAFVFLVALGTDYTIFLMTRVREEARTHGTREGMLRALAATGPVITSAGLILAGTFLVLMTLPVTFTFNIGFMVAAGVLLDTFVVRTIMVPAAIELLGDRAWWPDARRGYGSWRRRRARRRWQWPRRPRARPTDRARTPRASGARRSPEP
jgi:putative drug exporter of the RND superfamily